MKRQLIVQPIKIKKPGGDRAEQEPKQVQVQDTIIHNRVRHTQDIFFTSRDHYLWQIEGGGYSRNLYYGPFNTFRERARTQGFFPVPQFAEYPFKTDAENGTPVNIFHVIKRMRCPELELQTTAIRAATRDGDTVTKDRLKSLQPYITHTGIFIPRKNSGLIQPSFTYQLDIDFKGNQHIDTNDTLRRIIKDEQLTVLIASKSLSGKGIKALLFLKELLYIRDEWTHEDYRSVYHKATDVLSEYFLKRYGVNIDKQMKSISQPFYLFYSDDLYVNKGLRA